MSNKDQAGKLEARNRELTGRLTQALMTAAREPLRFAAQIPLLQASTTVAATIGMRSAIYKLQATIADDDATLASMIAESDRELSQFESSIAALLDQVENRP